MGYGHGLMWNKEQLRELANMLEEVSRNINAREVSAGDHETRVYTRIVNLLGFITLYLEVINNEIPPEMIGVSQFRDLVDKTMHVIAALRVIVCAEDLPEIIGKDDSEKLGNAVIYYENNIVSVLQAIVEML